MLSGGTVDYRDSCQVGTPVTPREPHAPKTTGNHTILGYNSGVPIHMWLDTEPIRDTTKVGRDICGRAKSAKPLGEARNIT
jgi:hypothetical protein